MGLLNTNFKEYFRSLLPSYIIREDSYKDNNQEGLVERFMVLFGEYLDTDISAEVENYLNIIDAAICEPKYLNHLSDVLGNPPDVFQNEEQYRNLLSYIVSVYKIKGTIRAYELFFSILGFITEIEEIPPLSLNIDYDLEKEYDTEENYDGITCHPCSFYSIKFYYRDSNEIIDLSTLDLLRAAIEFNEPINAKLTSLTMVVNLSDVIELGITDYDESEIEYTLEEMKLYDGGEIYDEDILDPAPLGFTIETDDLVAFLASVPSITDENDVSQWNSWLVGATFESVVINGDNIELYGEDALQYFVVNALINITGLNLVNQTTLIQLWVVGSNLVTMPTIVGDLPNLTTFIIADCDSTTVPSTTYLSGAIILTSIVITGNNLTVFEFDKFNYWAENFAPVDGFIEIGDNAEDLSTSDTTIELDAKNWDITN